LRWGIGEVGGEGKTRRGRGERLEWDEVNGPENVDVHLHHKNMMWMW